MGRTEVALRSDAAADSRPTERVDSFAYQPALDGVRAIAVVLVVLFHAGFGWMRAGYVGVSVFFTLSGFLITSLLITEHRRTSHVAIPAFFGRRVRRLLPASLLCLIAVGVAQLTGVLEVGTGARAELVGAATNVYNWVQIAGDDSYTTTFDSAPALLSPLEHYWSLAIEEQFYIVWPLVMAGLLMWVGTRRAAASWLGVIFLASALVAVVLAGRFGGDVAYWSTITRLPEILAGAALAGIVMTWTVPSWLGRAGLPALLAIIACAIWFPASGGPAYSGTMSLFSLLTVLLIASLQAGSSVRRVLSMRSLVALGAISYGVYLFHWPIFVWARQQGWDLTSPTGFVPVFVAVVAVAALSYTLVERPVRRMRVAPAIVLPAALIAVVGGVALVVAAPFPRGFLEADEDALDRASADPVDDAQPSAVPSPAPSVVVPSPDTVVPSSESARGDVGDPAPSSPTSDATSNPTSTPVDSSTTGSTVPMSSPPVEAVATDVDLPAAGPRPAKILTVGDSTAFYVGQALAQWTLDHPDHTRSDLLWCQGCGLILDGTITSWDADSYLRESRRTYEELLPAALERIRPDAVVMMSTVDDVTDRRWSDAEGVLTPFDERYRARMLDSYRDVAETLDRSAVGLVVWVKPPVPIWVGPNPEMRELGRWDVMGEVIDQVVAEHPDRMIAVDADAWMHAAGKADDESFRPDGTHLTEDSAYEMIDRWLAPVVLGELPPIS